MKEKRGIPAVAEAFGYVGGALALAALAALLVSFWEPIGMAGHVGIGLVLAVAGFGGGLILSRHEGDAVGRLSHFLLATGVAGVGFATGFAVRDVLAGYFSATVSTAVAADWGYFAGALAIAIAGGAVWWRERTVLQHLVFGIGVAAAALLALPLIPVTGYEWGAGAVLVTVALVWGALTWLGRIPPRTAGLALSALGIVGGLEIMATAVEPMLMWPLWVGVAACAALIWAGSRFDEPGVLGIATVALMVFAGQLIAEYLGFGAGTAMALIAFGFVLLAACVRMTLRSGEETPKSRRVTGEVLGYLGVALAMGGAGILLQEAWDELGTGGRIAVPMVGAIAAYGSAWLLDRSRTTTARRLSQTLYAIGVLSTAIAGAMIARPFIEARLADVARGPEYSGIWTGLAGAACGTVAGGITWRLRQGSLTQIAFVLAVVALVISGINFAELSEQAGMGITGFGGLLVLLGTAWTGLGAAELAKPARTALSLGGAVTFMGLQMLVRGDTGEFYLWGGLLGVAFGVAFIAGSIYLKRAITLGFGAVYVIMFSLMTVMEAFGGRVAAPVLLLVMGVVFIVVAVVVARAASHMKQERVERGVSGPPLSHA